MDTPQPKDLLTLARAARHCPKIGRRYVNPSTVWRWYSKGVKGIKLQAWRYGGRCFTTAEALDRFARELAEATASKPQAAPRRRPGAEDRDQRVEAARKQLQAAGI